MKSKCNEILTWNLHHTNIPFFSQLKMPAIFLYFKLQTVAKFAKISNLVIYDLTILLNTKTIFILSPSLMIIYLKKTTMIVLEIILLLFLKEVTYKRSIQILMSIDMFHIFLHTTALFLFPQLLKQFSWQVKLSY